MVFIVLFIIVTIVAGVAFYLALTFFDVGSFITDPTAVAFLEANTLFIPVVIFAIAGAEIIFLLVIYMWRKEPMAHRTGFTIIGIIMLLTGWSLPGLLILLPGLLMEEQ